MPSKKELIEVVGDLTTNLQHNYIEQSNLQERLAELELALEDYGWIRMTLAGEIEFSREGLGKINQLARLMYLKNPLIQRGVNVQAYYVFGQGMNISAQAEPVNTVIQEFLSDQKNQTELTSHQARIGKETELQIFSNLYFTFFINSGTGKIRVRTIPEAEIMEIITNPEDRKEPRLYKRVWEQSVFDIVTGITRPEAKTAYYPDWRYQAKEKPEKIGNNDINWDYPVYHVKTGGLPDMQFGVSEVYSAIDWARAYKEFLENWSTIVKAYARFAWKMTHPGGDIGMTAAQTALESTLSTSSEETNPPPVTASTIIGGEGFDMQPIRTAGATTSAEDGRRLLLMVAASVGLPESFFGDVSVGTLATAKSLDRPTELKMVARQTFWIDIYRGILEFVLIKAAEKGRLPASVEADDDGTPKLIMDTDPETGEPYSDTIDITFPPILEHDINLAIEAIADAATLKGQMFAGTIPDMKVLSRLLLTALGEENIDSVLDEMFPEEEAVEPAEIMPAEAMMIAAVQELREVLRGSPASA